VIVENRVKSVAELLKLFYTQSISLKYLHFLYLHLYMNLVSLCSGSTDC